MQGAPLRLLSKLLTTSYSYGFPCIIKPCGSTKGTTSSTGLAWSHTLTTNMNDWPGIPPQPITLVVLPLILLELSLKIRFLQICLTSQHNTRTPHGARFWFLREYLRHIFKVVLRWMQSSGTFQPLAAFCPSKVYLPICTSKFLWVWVQIGCEPPLLMPTLHLLAPGQY